jgi:hypothetical protein
MKQKIKPSLWWLIAAPLLFLLGAGGGTALLIWQVLGLHKGEPFLVPSTQTIKIEKKGTYILWYDYKIVFQGKVFHKSESLPDQCVIKMQHEEMVIPMSGTWGTSMTSGQHEKKEIGRYTIDKPGEYTLSVLGFEDERVCSFSRSGLKGVLGAAVACLFLNLLGWFGAPGVVLAVLMLRSRSQKKLTSNPTHAVSAGAPQHGE